MNYYLLDVSRELFSGLRVIKRFAPTIIQEAEALRSVDVTIINATTSFLPYILASA